MKIAGRRSHLTIMESVAMTDIVLNMFIFFFISFSLLYTFNPQRLQKLDVKLPKAANTSGMEKMEQINITMTNEGVLYFEQDVVTMRELKDKVRRGYSQNPSVAVVLRADRLVNFKTVVSVLDMLTEIGVSNLNIAAVKE
ncbi:MAG: biopolymer transporter ExbD [Candidatus Omnitrophica bacterium]|jgi:biopolymer transport protein ExbD|nr:biopolymer transporter ExbD [Candidatus Omnitrophota bacterium]